MNLLTCDLHRGLETEEPCVVCTSGLQPMETAPTDGTPVILVGTLWADPSPRLRACVSWYCRRRQDSPAYALGWFFSAPGYSNGFNPLRWMPLPQDLIQEVEGGAQH